MFSTPRQLANKLIYIEAEEYIGCFLNTGAEFWPEYEDQMKQPI